MARGASYFSRRVIVTWPGASVNAAYELSVALFETGQIVCSGFQLTLEIGEMPGGNGSDSPVRVAGEGAYLIEIGRRFFEKGERGTAGDAIECESDVAFGLAGLTCRNGRVPLHQSSEPVVEFLKGRTDFGLIGAAFGNNLEQSHDRVGLWVGTGFELSEEHCDGAVPVWMAWKRRSNHSLKECRIVSSNQKI